MVANVCAGVKATVAALAEVTDLGGDDVTCFPRGSGRPVAITDN